MGKKLREEKGGTNTGEGGTEKYSAPKVLGQYPLVPPVNVGLEQNKECPNLKKER